MWAARSLLPSGSILEGHTMKNILITSAIALLVGFGLGSQIFPSIKEKIVEIEKEVIVKDIVTVTKVITKHDGTKEEVTTTTDKTKENKQTTNTKTVSKPDWHTSINAKRKIDNPELVYGIQVERRILGEVFVGGSVNTQKEVGLSVGVSF